MTQSETHRGWSRTGYSSFYTPGQISDCLVKLLPCAPPARIIDLGTGTGSLSIAARNRWNNAKITTVDMNPNVSEIIRDSMGKPALHKHFQIDVFDARLSSDLSILRGSFDIALCNPPYSKRVWRKEYKSILDFADLPYENDNSGFISSELVFIAQNLIFTRDNGHIGLILSDTIVSGSTNEFIRRRLIDRHSLDRVIQLPRRTFQSTDALTYILLLKKIRPEMERLRFKN